MLAKKRMFDCTLVASNDFDDLSFMAQALYLRLIADTDDMGVAEAGGVIRYASRMRNSALQELIDGGFVTMIREKGKIVYVNGFHDNNSFANHGARESRYMAELQHNDYTKNVINKVKMKNNGYPMLGDDIATLGDVRLCNAERFRQVASKSSAIAHFPMLYDSLKEWYEYTDERGYKNITDKSINVLIDGCVERCESVGDYEVCEYISNAVASGYNSINWSWFDDKH